MAHVYVEVDMDEFSDDEVRAEAKSRGLLANAGTDLDLERLYDAVAERRIEDALLILERHLKPKWRDLQSCTDYFATARAQ